MCAIEPNLPKMLVIKTDHFQIGVSRCNPNWQRETGKIRVCAHDVEAIDDQEFAWVRER